MHPALSRNLYLVKEHVGFFKAANNYDIIDPDTNQVILLCREERLGLLTKLFRFTDYKRLTPFEVIIRTPDGQPVLCVKRGLTLLVSKVDVLNDQPLCTLKGNWTSWDFRFMAGEQELARVSKKWAGLGKELFTSADNYVLSISEVVPADNPIRGLILAAVMCIDLVLKE
jgi:uncharacterized protein YxjI